MGKLYDFKMEVLDKLVESSEAPQNFIESVINDLPETAVNTISDVSVAELSSNEIAGKVAKGFNHINGVVFNCKMNGRPAEVYLILEPVGYLQWWHDKNFFCDKFCRAHANASDGVLRCVTFVITDMDYKASRFHTVSHFNDRNGNKIGSFQIHDIYASRESGNEDSMLENWIRALVITSPEEDKSAELDNVANIEEARRYRVA